MRMNAWGARRVEMGRVKKVDEKGWIQVEEYEDLDVCLRRNSFPFQTKN